MNGNLRDNRLGPKKNMNGAEEYNTLPCTISSTQGNGISEIFHTLNKILNEKIKINIKISNFLLFFLISSLVILLISNLN